MSFDVENYFSDIAVGSPILYFKGNIDSDLINSMLDLIEEKLLRINNSTHEEITELYKFILNHQRISSKGGGGLGLVDIARKTGNKLEYVFKEYDEHNSFFCLNILVDDKK